MPRPDATAVAAYIATTGETYPAAAIEAALVAEAAAQAHTRRVPAEGGDWPADLAEALCRRVLVNLSMRSKPLGVEAMVSEAGVGMVRVGGRDPEVRRLERPYRRRPVVG